MRKIMYVCVCFLNWLWETFFWRCDYDIIWLYDFTPENVEHGVVDISSYLNVCWAQHYLQLQWCPLSLCWLLLKTDYSVIFSRVHMKSKKWRNVIWCFIYICLFTCRVINKSGMQIFFGVCVCVCVCVCVYKTSLHGQEHNHTTVHSVQYLTG